MVLAGCASDEQGRPILAQSGQEFGTPALPAFMQPTGEAVGFDEAIGSGGSDTLTEEDANDPLEGMNRYFFEINYALDETIFKAFAGWYRIALPQDARDGIRNALRNLRSPVILANDLFQGEFDRAGTTFARFVINSTAGLGGLFDVAGSMGMEYHDEDFGQTLGAHGVGDGPYLMLPLLGPTNPRDLVGRVVDTFLDPVGYLAPAYGLEALDYMRSGFDAVDQRERNLETLDDLRNGSLDYYATLRSVYKQSRDAAIANTEDELESAPAIFIDEDPEEEAMPAEDPAIEEQEPPAGPATQEEEAPVATTEPPALMPQEAPAAPASEVTSDETTPPAEEPLMIAPPAEEIDETAPGADVPMVEMPAGAPSVPQLSQLPEIY